MIIFEKIDGSQAVPWERKTRTMFAFSIDNLNYEVHFDESSDGKSSEVSFSVAKAGFHDYSYELEDVGLKVAVKVFHTTWEILQAYLNSQAQAGRPVSQIVFSSKSSEPTRTKFYKTLAIQLAEAYGFEAGDVEIEGGSSIFFYIPVANLNEQAIKKLNIIKEGGAAIGGKRIPRSRVNPTVDQYEKQVLSLLNISKWGPIGSTGLKATNGDIDLAIESSDSLEEIQKKLETNGIRTVMNKGLGEINTEFHQYDLDGTRLDDTVQVDLMVGDFTWLKFLYRGYSESDTKYKPLARTAVVYALLAIIPKEMHEDGSETFYSISPNRGFFKKIGKRTESGFKSKRVDPSNNNDPQQLADLLPGWTTQELIQPFEKIWALIEKRYDPETIDELTKYLKGFFTNQKMVIPSELPVNSTALKEATVAHMVHLEDLLYDEGEAGAEKVFNYLQNMFDTLKGHSSQMRTTVKIDGSPMVAMANNFPGVDGPFVGMKNTFAKVPQIFQSHEAIDEKYGHIPDLALKLKAGLDFVPLLGLPDGEIWKGDFLFTKDDLKIQSDEGKTYVTFKPNTIVYAVEKDSEIGSKVLQSDIGIVFHTIHKGEDVKSSESNVSYDVNADRLSPPDNALILDANLPSLAGSVFLTEEETQSIESKMAEAKSLFEEIDPSFLELKSTQKALLNKFENQAVRISDKDDQFFGDPKVYIEKFGEWLSEVYEKESLKKTTEKGRLSTLQRRDDILEHFLNNQDFLNLITLQQLIVGLKKFFISKLESLGDLIPYEELPDGSIKLTNHEGFAVSDIDGNIVKFVDRLVFSKANLTGHAAMKEARKLPQEVIQDVKSFADETGLIIRKDKVSSKKDIYVDDLLTAGVQVEPTEDNMTRKEKAQDILGKVPEEEVIEANIPSGDSRPSIILSRGDYVLSLEFAHKSGTGSPKAGKLSAIETKQMETWWMYYIQAALNKKEFPTDEETIEGFPRADADWISSFKSGAEKVYEYVNGDPNYILSREDIQVPESQWPAVHATIDTFFKTRKELMSHVGDKTDAWNPSDLYLCHTSFIDDFFSDWKQLISDPETTLDDANAYLGKALSEKVLIGISLKKLTNPSSAHLDTSKDIAASTLDCSLSRIKISTFIQEESPVGLRAEGCGFEFLVKGRVDWHVTGQYRYFGDTSPTRKYGGLLRIELKLKSGAAQLGKLPAIMLNFYADELGLDDVFTPEQVKSYLVDFSDDSMTTKLIQYSNNIKAAFGDICDVTPSNTSDYLNKLKVLRQTEKRPTSEFIKAGSIVQALYFVNLLAEADSQGTLNETLNDMLKRAAKMHDVNAPYIKLS